MITLPVFLKAIMSPVGMAVIASLILVGIVLYAYQEGKENGASAVIRKQNEIDRQVIDKSRDARDTVDRCRAAGGVWSRYEGKCQ